MQDRLSLFTFWGLLLIPLSHIYRVITLVRTRLYQKGVKQSRQLPCPVISIGNIIAGGTGKTPVAMHLALMLRGMGFQPVILSRGYKGEKSATGGIVSDGRTLFMTEKECGDEPLMMAKALKMPVVIGQDRYRAGCLAVESFDPDVIILDDGFQHLRLKRDLDIVLLDHDYPFGNQRLLPAGLLREPPRTALNRADMVIFTRCPDPPNQNPVEPFFPGVESRTGKNLPCFPGVWFTQHQPLLDRTLVPRNSDGCIVETLDDLHGKTAVAFSGIANNRAFADTLKQLGVSVLDHFEFSDHHTYLPEELAGFDQAALKQKPDILVTTQKDFARIGENRTWPVSLVVIGIRIKWVDKEDELSQTIRNVIKNDQARSV